MSLPLLTESALVIRANPPDKEKFAPPYKAVLDTPQGSWSAVFDLDVGKLSQMVKGGDPLSYGRVLYNLVFREGELHQRLKDAIEQTAGTGIGSLRLILDIDTGLAELHQIGWEYMFCQEIGPGGLHLAADQRLALLRRLVVGPSGSTPIRDTPRVLAGASSPSGQALKKINEKLAIKLEPLNLTAQTERLEKLVNDLKPAWDGQILPAIPPISKLTQITDKLRIGEYHVLHLVCHGVVIDGSASLLFGDAEGHLEQIEAPNFVEEIAAFQKHLRLIVLEVCHSAATENAFSGLAQQLLGAGIRAVVGMQGPWYTGKTSERFCNNFYRSLVERGNSIALAVQKGRAAVFKDKGRMSWEWASPVLYVPKEDFQLVDEQFAIQFEAPVPPEYFVERSEKSDDLINRLQTVRGKPGKPVVSALVGMPGSGKTVLAMKVAEEVKDRFVNGILWITLKQEMLETELAAILRDQIRSLDKDAPVFETLEKASQAFGHFIAGRKLLLVLDDAWKVAHVKPFLVGGEDCHVLITTREGFPATQVQAAVFELGEMNDGQGYELLERRLDRELTESEKEAAKAVAGELGYLPLGLELVAAQINGKDWKQLLDDLQSEIPRLEALEFREAQKTFDEKEKKLLSIRASYYLSLRTLEEDERERFAWLGVLPEYARITAAPVATIWGMTESKAHEELGYLHRKSLIRQGEERSGDQTRLYYYLHNIQRIIAQRVLQYPVEGQLLPGPGISIKKANTALLKRYQAKVTSKDDEVLWHNLPDDGYIFKHLTWHMEQADKVEQIYKLLTETNEANQNAWYQLRVEQGQSAGYIVDVTRAWQLSTHRNQAKAQRGGGDLQLHRETNYCLTISSLNTLPTTLPQELYVAIVNTNIWSPLQVLESVQRMADPNKKINTLIALIENLDGPNREEALRLGLTAATEWSEEANISEALSRLALHLTEELLDQAFAIAGKLKKGEMRDAARAQLARGLVIHGRVEEAIKLLRDEISEKYARKHGLILLLPYLPEPYLQEALDMADKMDPRDRDEVYSGNLLSRIAELGQPERFLQLVKRLPDHLQLKCLRDMAPFLSGEHAQQAIEIGLKTDKQLSDVYQNQAVQLALDKDTGPQLLTHDEMATVVKAMQASKKADSSKSADSMYRSDFHQLAQALFRLKLQLPEPDIQYGSNFHQLAQTVGYLALQLPEAKRDRLLRFVLAYTNQFIKRGKIYKSTEKYDRTIVKIIPYLSLEILLLEDEQIEETVRSFAEPGDIAIIAAHYAHLQLWGKALALANRSDMYRRFVYPAIAPYMDESQVRDEIGKVTADISDSFTADDVLRALLTRLAELGFAKEATALAGNYPEAIQIMAPFLNKTQVSQAVKELQRIDDIAYQGQALLALAPFAPDALLEKSFDKIRDGQVRLNSSIAGWWGKHLPLERCVQAFEELVKMEGRPDLLELLIYLPAPQRSQLVHRLRPQDLLFAVGSDNRPLLARIVASSEDPTIIALRIAWKEYALNEIRDISKLGGIDHLAVEWVLFLAFLGEAAAALELINQLPESKKEFRLSALLYLVSHLPESQKMKMLPEVRKALREGIPPYDNPYTAVIDIAEAAEHAPIDEALLRETVTIFLDQCEPEKLFAREIKTLAKRLSEMGAVDDGLALARTITITSPESRIEKAEALALIAKHQQPKDREETILEALKLLLIRDISVADHFQVVGLIGTLMANMDSEPLYTQWEQILKTLASYNRKDVLIWLGGMAPVIAKLGGEDAIIQTASVIEDVCHWWP